jgi:hypothetical protein
MHRWRPHRERERVQAAIDFYRPAKLADPRPKRPVKRPGPEQLLLNFEPTARYFSDAACPLKDVFPEAYPRQ